MTSCWLPAVRQQRRRAGVLVDHAAAHLDEQRPHALHHARVLQRANAARGQREIDRAPALRQRRCADPAACRTAMTLNPRRASSTASSAPGQPRADDVDGLRAHAAHARLSQRLRELLAETEHVFEAVVERHRRCANDVRLAPVADHAVRVEPLEHPRAAARARDAERKLAAARRRLARRDQSARRAQSIQQEFEIPGERHRLLAQPLDARFLEQRPARRSAAPPPAPADC